MRNQRTTQLRAVLLLALFSMVATLLPTTASSAAQTTEPPPQPSLQQPVVVGVADCNGPQDRIEFVRGKFSILCNDRSPIGTNTTELSSFSTEVPFTDLYRSAAPLGVQRTDGSEPRRGEHYRFDNAGWPTFLAADTVASTEVIKVPTGIIPKGNYVVLYDGEGVLSYHPGGGVTKNEDLSEPGRHIIRINDFEGQNRLRIKIESTNPNNYIRNIRVIMPGGVCKRNPLRQVANRNNCVRDDFMRFEFHHNGATRFNPAYLNYMKDFKVIRFLNMMEVNGSPIKGWNNQARMTDATWSSACFGCHAPVRSGVPVEIMAELANTLNADVWFTMPHASYDGYVTRFARTAKRLLHPNAQVYVEYTNETWNLITYKENPNDRIEIVEPEFSQAGWVIRQGCAYRAGRCPELTEDAATLRQYFDVGVQYHVDRSLQINRIWADAFTGDRERLTRVLARQFRDPNKSRVPLAYRNSAQRFDALAVAPYFDISDPKHRSTRDNPFVEPANLDQVFARIVEDRQGWNELLRQQFAIADSEGLDLIAYEAGQHLTVQGNDHQDLRELYLQANRDRRIADEYTVRNAAWKRVTGNSLNVIYTSNYKPSTRSPGFYWGLKESVAQPRRTAPKYNSVRSFIDMHPTR